MSRDISIATSLLFTVYIGITLIIILNYYKGRIKDKFLFVLGLFIFLLSLISLFLVANYDLISFIIYCAGKTAYPIAGFFFLVGCANCKMNLVKKGYHMGIVAWSLLLVSNYYGIFCYLYESSTIDIETLIMFYIIFWCSSQNIPFPFFPVDNGYSGGDLLGFYGYLVYLVLTYIGIILGATSVHKLKNWEVKNIYMNDIGLIKTILSKGFQTVIPSEIREKLNAEPGDEIIWSIIGDEVFIRLKKKNSTDPIKNLIGKFSTQTKDNATKELDKVPYEDQ